MKVTVRPHPAPSDHTLDKFAAGDVGIITAAPACTPIRPGDVFVMGINSCFVFPGRGTWSNSPRDYRGRELRPGESVLIEREPEEDDE